MPKLVRLVKVVSVGQLKFNFKSENILLAKAMPTTKDIGKEDAFLSCKNDFMETGFCFYH